MSSELKFTITDPWLGTREVGTNEALIRDQLKVLNHFKNDGRKPSRHLLEDIAVYEFILNSQDPEIFAVSYFRTINQLRDETGNMYIKKIEVARHLGWEIKI